MRIEYFFQWISMTYGWNFKKASSNPKLWPIRIIIVLTGTKVDKYLHLPAVACQSKPMVSSKGTKTHNSTHCTETVRNYKFPAKPLENPPRSGKSPRVPSEKIVYSAVVFMTSQSASRTVLSRRCTVLSCLRPTRSDIQQVGSLKASRLRPHRRQVYRGSCFSKRNRRNWVSRFEFAAPLSPWQAFRGKGK